MIKNIESQLRTIPAGHINLRDDRIKRTWRVDIEPFLLAEFPVTQEFYSSIIQNSPSTFVGDNNPVESVSWIDATTFCNELSRQAELTPCYAITPEIPDASFDQDANGYRLPLEAEWEFACKAGRADVRYGALDEIAWYKDNSGGTPQAVGQKTPNDWGLYDMLGNVWEWCWDQYDAEVYGSYRVFRGGGWSDPERGCLATNRRRSHPTFKIDDLGFRLARSL